MRAVGLAVALAAGVLAGCFSEHHPTAPLEGVCSIPLSDDVAGSTVVFIRNFAFIPAEVRVQAGERITWINCDPVQHTSTADGGLWDSPLLSLGDGFTVTFSSAGEFPYHCEVHPFMTGRVIVE